jgi:hypothetical protein
MKKVTRIKFKHKGTTYTKYNTSLTNLDAIKLVLLVAPGSELLECKVVLASEEDIEENDLGTFKSLKR